MYRSFMMTIAATAAAAALQAQTLVPEMKAGYEGTKNKLVRMAEKMPEEHYSFKATPEIRSFGELVGHVAGAQYMFCAMALGEEVLPEGAVEESMKSKADLVAALKASTEYCNRAYALTDDQLTAPVTIFGQENTRMGALVMNSNHNAEHYGNMVVYLRLNGIVPPSSRGGM